MIAVRDLGTGETLRGASPESIARREYGKAAYLYLEAEPFGRGWHRAAVRKGDRVMTTFYWEDREMDGLDDAILSVIGSYCNAWVPLPTIKEEVGAETTTQRHRVERHVESMLRYGILEKDVVIIKNHPITLYRVRRWHREDGAEAFRPPRGRQSGTDGRRRSWNGSWRGFPTSLPDGRAASRNPRGRRRPSAPGGAGASPVRR